MGSASDEQKEKEEPIVIQIMSSPEEGEDAPPLLLMQPQAQPNTANEPSTTQPKTTSNGDPDNLMNRKSFESNLLTCARAIFLIARTNKPTLYTGPAFSLSSVLLAAKTIIAGAESAPKLASVMANNNFYINEKGPGRINEFDSLSPVVIKNFTLELELNVLKMLDYSDISIRVGLNSGNKTIWETDFFSGNFVATVKKFQEAIYAVYLKIKKIESDKTRSYRRTNVPRVVSPQQDSVKLVLSRGTFGIVHIIQNPAIGASEGKSVLAMSLDYLANLYVRKSINITPSHPNLGLTVDVLREIFIINQRWSNNLLQLTAIGSSVKSQHSTLCLYSKQMVSLRDVMVELQKTTRLQEKRDDFVMWVTKGVLDGIRALHENNVTHRDLKPENILLDDECVVKICDFGKARYTDKTDYVWGNARPTTLNYAPPELVTVFERREYKSLEYDGKRVDMWSFGCIVFELWFRKIYTSFGLGDFNMRNIAHADMSIGKLGTNELVQNLVRGTLKFDALQRLTSNECYNLFKKEHTVNFSNPPLTQKWISELKNRKATTAANPLQPDLSNLDPRHKKPRTYN